MVLEGVYGSSDPKRPLAGEGKRKLELFLNCMGQIMWTVTAKRVMHSAENMAGRATQVERRGR
jgi:hypothetical protein